MAGDASARAAMQQETPHCYTALTHLVVAMAATEKNLGKKTWFGHDKGLKAYGVMLGRVRELLMAMTLDGLVSPTMATSDVLDKVVALLDFFCRAHPNWQDAYRFALSFFVESRAEAIATLDRLR